MYRSLQLFVIAFAALTSVAQAQTYIYTESTGNVPFMYYLRYYLEMKFDGPADDKLSEWQPLPFEWSFYGQPVTGYYISDNGYLTFDKNATASISQNTVLPNPAAPRNAIFGFWDALHLDASTSEWSNCVHTATIGIAPHRQHIIYWIGVAPERYQGSSSNTLSFLVVLNEGAGFDVVFAAGAHRPDMSGTIGAQNATGELGTMVPGAPDMEFPLVTADPNDDVTYSFTYSDSQLDGAAAEALLPKTAQLGKDVPVKFVVQNTGSQTILAFDAHYVGNNEVLFTKRVDGIQLPTNGKYTITFEDAWTAENPGAFTNIMLWIDNVDAGGSISFDTNQLNDTLIARVWVQLGITAPRRVLMEEFTGAWCGWCPDGAVKMQELEAEFGDDVSLVAVHADGVDSMITQAGQIVADQLANGFPSGLVDRVKFPGEDRQALTRSKWRLAVAQRLNEGSPLTITANSTFDPTTRRLDVRAFMEYTDYPYPADYRLNIWLVEDRVMGSGKGWDQANYFSGNTSYPSHPFFSLPNPVPDYVHRHVLRGALSEVWGQPLGYTHTPNILHWKNYSVVLPGDWNQNEVSVLVFVSTYDAAKGVYDVVNSFMAPLGTITSAGSEAPETFALGAIAPHPVVTAGTVSLTIPSMQPVHIALYSPLGREIHVLRHGLLAPGTHTVGIDASGLKAGVYFIVYEGGGIREVRPLVVVR